MSKDGPSGKRNCGEQIALFYVSTKGRDAWSGTLPEPNAAKTDGPLATLHHARDVARKAKAAIDKGRVEIQIRGGKYFLDQLLLLSPEDGGTQDCPIVWSAYAGETPILSGGAQLKNWKPWKDGILQCSLPEAKGGKWKFRQLFLNGRRQTRCRWPKLDKENPLYGGWAMTEGPADTGANPHAVTAWGCADYLMPGARYDHGVADTFRYKEGFLQRNWAKPTEGEVISFCGPGWGQDVLPIKSVDREARTITLTRDIWQFDCAPWYRQLSWMPNNRFRVENILEELSDPGEWCLDTEEGIVYFKPPHGRLKDNDSVTVPRLRTLIHISGAAWISIRGLTFTETLDGDNTHRDFFVGYGGMFPRQEWTYCGEAVRMRRASHCAIEECRFDQTGGNGIYMEWGCFRNRIAYNTLCGCGANGIVLIGDHLDHPLYNEVEDNHIFDCGVMNKFVAGVFLGVSDGNRIAHNHIHDMPHHGVNLGTNGRGRNFIEFNRIERTAREIFDTAAINSWMDMSTAGIIKETERTGHVIRYNFIGGVTGCQVDQATGKVLTEGASSISGIYLDDCTSNCLVFGNIIVRAHTAMVVHLGKNNWFENNIVVDCHTLLTYTDTVSRRPGNAHLADFMRGNRNCRNILYTSRPGAVLYHMAKWSDKQIELSDENLFFNTTGEGYQLIMPPEKPLSFAEWQRMGYDVQSIIADPLFVDPAHDDFRLKPESPALNLGFQPIDIAQIGIRKRNAAK